MRIEKCRSLRERPKLFSLYKYTPDRLRRDTRLQGRRVAQAQNAPSDCTRVPLRTALR